jgi:gas vesicle protein
MNKSLIGIILGAAAIALAVSPEGRKATRKLAVRGTTALLELKDQIKDAANQLPSVRKENKTETIDRVI